MSDVLISFFKTEACDLATVWKHLSVKFENSVLFCFFLFYESSADDYIQGEFVQMREAERRKEGEARMGAAEAGGLDPLCILQRKRHGSEHED